MHYDLTPEERLASAREWAASIQTRFAERLSGGLARRMGPGATPGLSDHLAPLRRAARAIGINPAELDAIERAPAKISEFDDPDVAGRIQDLYAAPVFVGSVRASAPWLPDPAALPLAALLTLAMERFVVAHELAHLMLGHLDTAAESVAVADPAFADAAATVFSRQAELEADAAGAVLTLETPASRGQFEVLSAVAPTCS